jgi:cell division initiation protein
LRDRVELLEHELRRHRELESLLRETLVSAEKSAAEVKDNARAEAELVVRDAHSQARTITREAVSDRERLLAETRRVRALLTAALQSVEEADREIEKPRTRPAQAA